MRVFSWRRPLRRASGTVFSSDETIGGLSGTVATFVSLSWAACWVVAKLPFPEDIVDAIAVRGSGCLHVREAHAGRTLVDRIRIMIRKSTGRPAVPKKPSPATDEPTPPEEDWELSKSQLRELNRRIRDLDDPRRYVLASEFAPKFVLYYEVGRDVYVMNELSAATVFKRRKAAVAIKALLGKGVRVVECLISKKGKLKRVTPVRPRFGQTRKAKKAESAGTGGGDAPTSRPRKPRPSAQ